TALGLEMSDLFAKKKAKPIYEFECAYDYRDEPNQVLFQSVRLRLTNPHECPEAKPKDFKQRRPKDGGGWIYDLKGVRRVLHRLPELIAAPPDATVFIVEGEKDADRLSKLGLIVTTNPMGAGKWRKDFNGSLHGRKVVILPDNDKPGREHAQDVAKQLH